jgi:Histidine kinase-, DNA gyrase B-, and HSP90-like ATPase
MDNSRVYEINIEPRILELLGPSLYTSIYYVLAELVANAYDANASNVYIIRKDVSIVVEDDGTGMSYRDGEVGKYLKVAIETRTTEAEAFTDASKQRRKIGRKGVGKLAALSVSEDVLVMTSKNGENSGFVLSRHVAADRRLKPLNEEEIRFEKITGNGTSIVMTHPQYGMHKSVSAIKKNLLKIFPLVNEHFRIHIISGQDEVVVDSFDKEIIGDLGALLILGDDFHYLAGQFDSTLENKEEAENYLLRRKPSVTKTLSLVTKTGEKKDFSLEIKGWLGVYRSTRGRKDDPGDFPDNFISLIALGKLGEYNILPAVGRNKLQEVFVVGQLHVDLLEETELPDIALSNRQGYKSDDERYQFVLEHVRDVLLPEIVDMREKYTDFRDSKKRKEKEEQQKKREEELRKKVETYKSTTSKSAVEKIMKQLGSSDVASLERILDKELNASMGLLGLKQTVDGMKKKVLICHTAADKALADVVYNMLSFNDVSDEEIIYTSCENEAARIPEDAGVFKYLREFFVESYSTEKIMVIYVTSDTMAKSWGAVAEVGAGWITRMDHKIFNVRPHRPQLPLDIEAQWQSSTVNGDSVAMSALEFDKFIVKVLDTCKRLGMTPKSKEANNKELKRYVSVVADPVAI